MEKEKGIAGWLLLIIAALIILIPFYIIIIASTYTTPNMYQVVSFLPGDGFSKNWKILVDTRNFFQYIWNSLFVAVIKSVLTVFICSLAGYALAKYDFKWNRLVFLAVIISMLIPGSVYLVALMTEIRFLGWMNTYLPLIIIGSANAFSVFWFRQTSMDIPNEILESAYVDGSGEFRTFFCISLPLLRSSIVTLSIITFFNSWNDFMLPSIVLTSPEKYTIPVGIANLGTLYYQEYAPRILAVLIGIAPVLALYLCTSRYITRGLLQGAVKG